MEELPTGEPESRQEIADTPANGQGEIHEDYLTALAYINQHSSESPGIDQQLEKEGDITDKQVTNIMKKVEQKTGRSTRKDSSVD